MVKLILASGSPRRRELIKAFDLDIEVVSPDLAEGEPLIDESPADYVVRLSENKARSVANGTANAYVLGADTTVVLDGEVFGKPSDDAEATQMLQRLRGRTHTVMTGVSVLDTSTGKCESSVKCTDVALRSYSDAEIAAWVESGESSDKAGAYAVQDENFRPASRVSGCYTNAVGLPLCEVVDLMNKLGVNVQLNRDWYAPEQCLECPIRAKPEADVL